MLYLMVQVALSKHLGFNAGWRYVCLCTQWCFRGKSSFNVTFLSCAFTCEPVPLILGDACVTDFVIDTEPENGWGSKGPLEVIWSHPLLKQGHPGIIAQDHFLMAFGYLHAWRPYTFSGQPVPVLIHAHTEKKNVSWCSEATFSISLCAHCLVLSMGNNQKCLTVSLAHCLQEFVHSFEILPCVWCTPYIILVSYIYLVWLWRKPCLWASPLLSMFSFFFVEKI